MPQTKNSDSEQKHRVENDEGVKKKSRKRKLSKPDIKNSKNISCTESGSDTEIIWEVHYEDPKPKISNTLVEEPPIGTINSEIMPYRSDFGEVRHSSRTSRRRRYSSDEKRRPCTGSNFAKIPIVSEIPKIINPAAWVASKTQKDTKPIKN